MVTFVEHQCEDDDGVPVVVIQKREWGSFLFSKSNLCMADR